MGDLHGPQSICKVFFYPKGKKCGEIGKNSRDGAYSELNELWGRKRMQSDTVALRLRKKQLSQGTSQAS